jgi:hypothetical protein
MPYGTGPLIRQALLRASPWQRYVIVVAMVAAGAVLVLFGHVAGAVLSIAGLLLLWRMVRYRLKHKHVSAEPARRTEQR